MTITTGERGRFFEFNTRRYQIVPRFEGLKNPLKLDSHWHLRGVCLAQEARDGNKHGGRANGSIPYARKR